jgi:tetratricopeptide (TPR) repeat protein
MAKWTAFPHADKAYQYTEATLKKNWARLHRGDCEPWPKDKAAIGAWIAYHAGDFGKAVEQGVAGGLPGYNAANKAAAVYATYLESSEKRKLEILQEAAARAEELQAADPKDANAWYLYAFATGRYSQGISVAKALAQGLGGKVKEALTRTLKLQPKHADAHIAFGSWHAEIIDKVGGMIGGMTYGAKRDEALKHYKAALELNPDSAIARIEYANGLVMLDGKKALAQAEQLYAEAAAFQPMDAMERLDVEQARSEME